MQLVADLVRARKCVAPPELVTTLFVLRFPDIAPPKGEEGASGSRHCWHVQVRGAAGGGHHAVHAAPPDFAFWGE